MTTKWLMGTALVIIMASGAMAQTPAQDCSLDEALTQGMTAQERFRALDENGDEQLSRQEYLDCLDSKQISLNETDRQAYLSRFDEIDADGSGFLMIAEVEAIAATAEATRVDVEQQPATVEVSEGEPTVTVDQQSPTVTVEQSEPRVSVETTQPEVTVDQPAPEVKVTQPEPEVVINQPQAEVVIEQPQARVAINQPEPEVRVTQAQPRVSVELREPEVTVEQPTPEVSVIAAEPVIEIAHSEPNIVIERVEPEVIIERVSDVDADVGGTSDPERPVTAVANETGAVAETEEAAESPARETAGANDTGDAVEPEMGDMASADDTAVVAEAESGAGDQSELLPMAYADFKGKPVYNAHGEEIGTVEDVLLDPRVELPVLLLSVGGFLGIGGTEVVFPMEQVSVDGDRVVLQSDLSKEQFETLAEYDSGRFEPLPDEMKRQ